MKPLTLGLILALLAALLGTAPTPVLAASYVVNVSADDADAHDVNPGDGTCADIYGSCPLRAAIEEANAHSGADTITFQSAMNIYIDAGESVLPSLDETVTIDASSVWDTVNDAPGVMLNGQGGSFGGLYLGADGCQIYGLYITYFNGSGIYVVSAANWIGGTGAGQRNVISGNDTGIGLVAASAHSNVVRNNYIGLTPAGNTKNPNGTGLVIYGGAHDNIIGGNGTNYANYVSGNTSNGVMIEMAGTDNNWLAGNGIGVSANLTTNLGNGAFGIRIQDNPDNTVIGGASGAGNFIAYNAYSGVYVVDAGSGTEISYNIIGGNNVDGVDITTSSGCIVSNNFIDGNTSDGVRIVGASAAGNLIWPNSIYNNGGKGIHLQEGGNMGIAAPTITSAGSSGASGSTTCPWCTVALYSDASDEGQVYHGATTADGTGHWTYSGVLTGPNVTATTIDVSGNTSEFSAPFKLGYQVFLPLAVRNH